MVNHIRTLLLNMNSDRASAVADWYVDPSFVPVSADSVTAAFIDILFGDGTDEDRVRVVDFCMPFMVAPEFSWFFDAFDPRVSCGRDVLSVSASSVHEFTSSLSGVSGSPGAGTIGRVSGSDLALRLFQHVGDAELDDVLDKLKRLYLDSMKTWKSFSSVLFAIVTRLEFSRRSMTVR